MADGGGELPGSSEQDHFLPVGAFAEVVYLQQVVGVFEGGGVLTCCGVGLDELPEQIYGRSPVFFPFYQRPFFKAPAVSQVKTFQKIAPVQGNGLFANGRILFGLL